jgi:phosphatidylinositol alpha-mannosyltransferase
MVYMKIGLLIDDHMQRPGGVQEYVRGLAQYLQRHNHEVVIFTQRGPDAEAATPNGLRIVGLGATLPLRGSGSSTSIPLTLQSPRAVRRLLRREACDVLHVMAPYSPTLSGRLLVQSAAAHVMTFLVAIEPGPYRALLGRLARTQARSLRRFRARIAISATAAGTGQALYGGSYQIIPCGVDTTQFRPDVPPLPQLRDGMINVLYVGRLEGRKGVAHLVRAWARIEHYYPNTRLIVGGDGPERAALERLVQQLGLQRVRFLGYVSAAELPNLFASADVFCAPATYAESFGIVLIEAMAAGLPVVAAANAGYAGLLAAHPGNLVVPPGDDRVLASALAALLDAPGYRHTLGARNAQAVARYSWDVVGDQIAAVYADVLVATRPCR